MYISIFYICFTVYLRCTAYLQIYLGKCFFFFFFPRICIFSSILFPAVMDWIMSSKIFESPLDSKVKSLNPKGNQPWIFTGKTDSEAELPILWPPDAKSWSLEKILMLRKIEGRKRRGQQRIRWLNGITDSMDMTFEQTSEDGKGQKSLEYCNPWQRVGHNSAYLKCACVQNGQFKR